MIDFKVEVDIRATARMSNGPSFTLANVWTSSSEPVTSQPPAPPKGAIDSTHLTSVCSFHPIATVWDVQLLQFMNFTIDIG